VVCRDPGLFGADRRPDRGHGNAGGTTESDHRSQLASHPGRPRGWFLADRSRCRMAVLGLGAGQGHTLGGHGSCGAARPAPALPAERCRCGRGGRPLELRMAASTPRSSRSRWPARVITPKHCRRSRSCSACSWGMVASRRGTSSTAVARRTDAPVSPMVRAGRCGRSGRSASPPETRAHHPRDFERCSTRPPRSLCPLRTMATGSRPPLPTTGRCV